jgi:hypothetical protein
MAIATPPPLYATNALFVDAIVWLEEKIPTANGEVVEVLNASVSGSQKAPFVLAQLVPGDGPEGPGMAGDQWTYLHLQVTCVGRSTSQAQAIADLVAYAWSGLDATGAPAYPIGDLAGVAVLRQWGEADKRPDVVNGVPQVTQTLHAQLGGALA